jgi:hypothetical protein
MDRRFNFRWRSDVFGAKNANEVYMKKLWLLPLTMAVVSLAGCGGEVVAYYAPVPPPPLQVEAYGATPGPGNIWINGYWGYEGGRHVWHAGRWEKPPRPNAHYVAARWEKKGNQYAFREGHWK